MSQTAISLNLAEELRAVSHLVRSEMQFRQLLERLPAGAYTCDPQGLITYFNPSALQLWGRAPKLNDPVDRFCGSFKLFRVDGTPIAHDECWMALALQQEKEFSGHEIVIERPDGQRVTALAHANPIRDDSGRLLGAVNVLVDISDRKHAEDVLREADRVKNEFIATLAHELRNPLAPIRNAVEILQLHGEDPSERKWALEVIDRQLRQMTRLIEDLLDLGRITGNKLELRRELVDVADVLQAAAETSRPLVDASGHQLELVGPPEPILLDGDLTRLAQIVSNLLNNAAKYTPRGGIIRLEARRVGNEAVVTVRDTGIGIHASTLPRVFEMFRQGEHASDRSNGGLGIGLALARRLAELHGGTITAYSDGPGKGSEFTVRLPALSGAPEIARAESGRSVPSDGAFSLRVLVADDNEESAGSLSKLLALMGHEVRTAQDGLEAVEVSEEFRPDVILLDIGMPKMNGYEAAQRIRERPWGRETTLIALTGWGQETDRRRSSEAGLDHHIVKPLDPGLLTRLLEETHSAKRANQPP